MASLYFSSIVAQHVQQPDLTLRATEQKIGTKTKRDSADNQKSPTKDAAPPPPIQQQDHPRNDSKTAEQEKQGDDSNPKWTDKIVAVQRELKNSTMSGVKHD